MTLKQQFEKIVIVRNGKPVVLAQQELRKPNIKGEIKP